MNVGLAIGTVSMPPYIMAVTGERERPHAFPLFAALIPFAALVGSIIAGVLPGLWAARLGVGMESAHAVPAGAVGEANSRSLGILPLVGADPATCMRRKWSAASKFRYLCGGQQAGGRRWDCCSSGASLCLSPPSAKVGAHVLQRLHEQCAGRPPATIGVIMGAAQILPILAALALPLALTHWGAGYTLGAGLLVLAACLAPLAATPQLWLAAAAYMGAMASFTIVGAGRRPLRPGDGHPTLAHQQPGGGDLWTGDGECRGGGAGRAVILAVGFGVLYLFGMAAAFVGGGAAALYLYLRGRRRTRLATEGSGARRAEISAKLGYCQLRNCVLCWSTVRFVISFKSSKGGAA